VQIEIDVQGQRYPRTDYWFTDAYERRNGRWQIVCLRVLESRLSHQTIKCTISVGCHLSDEWLLCQDWGASGRITGKPEVFVEPYQMSGLPTIRPLRSQWAHWSAIASRDSTVLAM